MKISHRFLFPAFLGVLIIAGCTAPPTEGTVREAIIRHFEAKKYRVLELDIGSVESGPLGEKTYMAPEGYLVKVRKITLEMTEDFGTPWNYRRGQAFTFRNAEIRIRREKGAHETWIVGTVSGIAVR